jgi:hypothetical protein
VEALWRRPDLAGADTTSAVASIINGSFRWRDPALTDLNAKPSAFNFKHSKGQKTVF